MPEWEGNNKFRAADLCKYNCDSTMMLAIGQIDPVADLFADSFTETATVSSNGCPWTHLKR